MMRRYFDTTVDDPPGEVTREEIYRRLRFPRGAEHPSRRPYTAINMVATVDGKVVVGGPGTTRLIGGSTDHYLMGKIEFRADAVLMGAGLARADNPPYPSLSDERKQRRASMRLRRDPLWVVVSTRGEFPAPPRLFEAGPEKTALFTSRRIADRHRQELERRTRVIVQEGDEVDALEMGRVLREELGVQSMICIGGPTTNATMLDAGAADELFVTLAPKLQGGTHVATLLEGESYPPEQLPWLELLSLYGDEHELYLRYRLPPAIRRTKDPVDRDRPWAERPEQPPATS